MSTNYYAHIIPSHKRKKELYNAIEANDFPLINKLKSELYDSVRIDYEIDDIIGGVVHLGTKSSGWKFLWNPNVFVIPHGLLKWIDDGNNCSHSEWVRKPSTLKYLYPLTKKGLKDFIDREDVLIYDEYDSPQDKEEFWKMALEWGYEKGNEGWDAASYEEKHTSYPVTSELTDLLKKEGYKFTSHTNTDFYSDGLRFAGFTDFS